MIEVNTLKQGRKKKFFLIYSLIFFLNFGKNGGHVDVFCMEELKKQLQDEKENALIQAKTAESYKKKFDLDFN